MSVDGKVCDAVRFGINQLIVVVASREFMKARGEVVKAIESDQIEVI